ncbi:MAG: tRNA (adenosine(37)-N6)-threonylcarbamoyltransferase complex ATPase subunit type 1 TsaE [Pikeienuella sp.]
MPGASPDSAPFWVWRRELPSEAATDRLGRALGPALVPGDVVTLSGPLGAGKSVLARALIRSVRGVPDLEVPSPSYTLVNVYGEDAQAVWHADLYRLSGSEEVTELGLEEAYATLRLVVEWPERWGSGLPARRLEIALAVLGDTRRSVEIRARGGGWSRVAEALAAELEPRA